MADEKIRPYSVEELKAIKSGSKPKLDPIQEDRLSNPNFKASSNVSKSDDGTLDDAQKLYHSSAEKLESQDNTLWVALGLAIASWVPLINYFNFLFAYNIVSTVFAIKILKKADRTSQENIIAIISLVLNGLRVLLVILAFLLYVLVFSKMVESGSFMGINSTYFL